MAIRHEAAAEIVYGPSKKLHMKVRGAMLAVARSIRDNPGSEEGELEELRQWWARRVMKGDDSSYQPILRELSLKQVIQDGMANDDHEENVVRNQVRNVLNTVIIAQLI